MFLGTQNELSGTPPKGSWSSRDHFWSKWPLAETRKQPFLRQLQNGENELRERDPPRGSPKNLKIVAFKPKTRLKQTKISFLGLENVHLSLKQALNRL